MRCGILSIIYTISCYRRYSLRIILFDTSKSQPSLTLLINLLFLLPILTFLDPTFRMRCSFVKRNDLFLRVRILQKLILKLYNLGRLLRFLHYLSFVFLYKVGKLSSVLFGKWFRDDLFGAHVLIVIEIAFSLLSVWENE